MTRNSQFILTGTAIACLIAMVASRRTIPMQSAMAYEAKRELGHIGVIDVSRVFKSSEYFIEKRKVLKEAIADEEGAAKEMAQNIKELSDKLLQLEEDTDEHADTAAELKQAQAEFEAFRKEAQRRIMNSEAEIYRDTFEKTMDVVKDYAEADGLELVLQFNSNPLKDENPQKLMESFGRAVLYHRDESDITDEVIAILNNSDR